MKMYCMATSMGLVPCGDDEYEKKQKLKTGEVYTCDIRLSRNIKLHRKYFSMLNCAWEMLGGKQSIFNNSKDMFRKFLQVKAGYYDSILVDGEIIQMPVSIGYDSMDNADFTKLYESVREILFDTFLKHISQEEFEKNLLGYY